jgi:hypothetical protein
MPLLEKLADDVWIVASGHSMLGLHLGTRMTVVRLTNGGLLLHSPVPMSGRLGRQHHLEPAVAGRLPRPQSRPCLHRPLVAVAVSARRDRSRPADPARRAGVGRARFGLALG